MISELNEVWTAVLGTISALGGAGGVWAWRHNKKMRALERQLKDSEVSKAKIESKADEFHLLKEMLTHAQNQAVAAERREAETAEWWRAKHDDMVRKHDEQTGLLREARATIAAKDEQIQEEKDLNTEYERTIAELMEENTYLHSWVCHKGECDNGVPPRGRLRGMVFDMARLVRTGQRLRLLDIKHNGINIDKE